MATVFTSTTAPGKFFSSRGELAEHYKSDWHKYNLKRREAGLPLLGETDFRARWEAALALRKEKETKERTGTDHLKSSKRSKKKQPPLEAPENSVPENGPKHLEPSLAATQENPEIDPKQCLFDSHISGSLEQNVQYMNKSYGFFIPDRECLRDLEGFLGYCHEKIKLGHYCLYCEKMFPTWQGCQQHMVSKQHTKIRYEQGYWEELDPFYDFDRDNAMFAGTDHKDLASGTADAEASGSEDDEEGGWEDVSEGGDVGMVDLDDGHQDEDLYEAYEKEIAKFGLDVSPLGELVFPDGRVVGHRALRRYYNQRARPATTSTAVTAAKRAAGERLYEGRIVNIGSSFTTKQIEGLGSGILVPQKDGAGEFSSLSLYRFRAALQKQRRDDDKGRRLKQRTTQNINKMDKKANRLMNGVSVAHAAR